MMNSTPGNDPGRKLDYPVWTADLLYNNSTGGFRVEFNIWNNVIYYDHVFKDRGPMVRGHDGRYTLADRVFRTKLDAMKATLIELAERQVNLKTCVDRLIEDIALEQEKDQSQ